MSEGAADIVARLTAEGENAMRQHLSLGMHKLCAEAADEIQRLRDALRPFAEAYNYWAPKTNHLTLSISTKDLARAAELLPL